MPNLPDEQGARLTKLVVSPLGRYPRPKAGDEPCPEPRPWSRLRAGVQVQLNLK